MENAAVREFTGIHNMIRGLIRLVDTGFSSADSAVPAQMAVLADAALFAVEGTRFHHQGEDEKYWPAVIANGADASVFEPLTKEHHEIEPLLDDMDRAARGLKAASNDAGKFDTLRGLFGQFRDHILTHLDNEEPIFFPLLNEYLPDDQAERLATAMAKKAPRKGISWLMGGVEYAMTDAQAAEFLRPFPKPIVWLRPLFLRTYRKNCGVLRVDPATASSR